MDCRLDNFQSVYSTLILSSWENNYIMVYLHKQLILGSFASQIFFYLARGYSFSISFVSNYEDLPVTRGGHA